LYRQIIGYFPSNAIPAIVSVVMIYAFTRLLSPAAFGSYSFVFSAVLVLQTSLFYALPIAVMRFFPGAAVAGRRDGLLKEAYVVFYVMCLTIIAICVCVGLLINLPDQYRIAAWLALPMLLFRSLVQLNQSVNRSSNLMRRFNTIECVHAVLGFVFGLAAMYVLGHGPEAIIVGLLIAAVICSSVDFPLLVSPVRRTAGVLDKAELLRLVEYAWPLVAVAATGMILQNSDRFLLGSLASAEVLGIFAVAYNLVERPTTLICSSISTATFPLVVQVLEHQGREAARLQAGRNGIALLAVTLPTCAGLALTADYVSASLVGPAFRTGVAALLPIMCFTALARGLRAHFIDHAFHLSGRPLLMLWTYSGEYRAQYLRRAALWHVRSGMDGAVLPSGNRGGRLVSGNRPLPGLAAGRTGSAVCPRDRAYGRRADVDPVSPGLVWPVRLDPAGWDALYRQRCRVGRRGSSVDRLARLA
jgi:O-antigen/teichoic acid export membrane protein